MPRSLLYVSKTLLDFPGGEPEVQRILDVSIARNKALGVTGALISTRTYFAQILEGEPDAVGTLMRSINDDARHMKPKIIRDVAEARRFAAWSMAYSGYAVFVDRHIAPLFSHMAAVDTARLSMNLINMMQEFVRLPPV